MRYIIYSLLFIGLISCSGSLSEKDRKALQAEKEKREIKKVSEEEVVRAAFKHGRKIAGLLSPDADQDSLTKAHHVIIYSLPNVSGDTVIYSDVDQELFEAYDYAANNGMMLEDNVQRDEDFMVYTVPKIDSGLYKGIYVIRLSRKDLILGL